MNTSRKILIGVAGFIIVLLISVMVLVRNGVESMQIKANQKYKYVAMPVQPFKKLDFSSHWIVKISQGKECKVEYAAKDHAALKPKIENIDGTLFFMIEPGIDKQLTGSIPVRITMPSLQTIKAVGSTEISVEYFQADSVSVILENGVVFTGKNNSFNHASYKTTGDSRLQFTDNL
jgi:hypothetical protein